MKWPIVVKRVLPAAALAVMAALVDVGLLDARLYGVVQSVAEAVRVL